MSDEALKIFRIFCTLNEALSQKALEIPKSFGIANETQPMFLKKVAKPTQIVLEALIVKIPPYMELPQVPHIAQHLHELQIFDELAIELVSLFSVVGHHLRLLTLHILTFLLEIIGIGL